MSRNSDNIQEKSRKRSGGLQARLVAWLMFFAFLVPAWLPASPARSAEGAALKTNHWALTKAAREDNLSVPVGSPYATAVPAVFFREFSEGFGVKPWRWNPAGEVIAPILLYHHVGETDAPSRYFVSPSDFEAQMRSLHEWGYTAIPLSLLVQALSRGAILPPRPVVISFDDGYQDVYTNAFPIMQKYGYPGIAYIITGQLEIGGYMHSAELRNLLAAGWEIGSHTQTHTSLRSAGAFLGEEVSGSRQALESLTGVEVGSFSFPYGLTSRYVTALVQDSGYTSAVGLGAFYRHTQKTQYYLSRIEIHGDFTLQEFASLLPWAGEIASLAVREPQSPREDMK